MKKLISIILILAMLVGLISCGQNLSVEQAKDIEQINADEIAFVDKITLSYFGTIYQPGDVIEVGEVDTITVLINGTSTVSAPPFSVYTDFDNDLHVIKGGEHHISFAKNAVGTTYFIIETNTASEKFILTSNGEGVDTSDIDNIEIEIVKDTESYEYSEQDNIDKMKNCHADELYLLGLISGFDFDEYGNPIYRVNEDITISEVNSILHKLGTDGSVIDTCSIDNICVAVLSLLGYPNQGNMVDVAKQLGIIDAVDIKCTRGEVYSIIANALNTNINGKKVILVDTVSSLTDEMKWHWKNAKRAQENIIKSMTIDSQKYDKRFWYKVPSGLGGKTLSYTEAMQLVGRAPFIVQNRVKTFADVLQYSMAAAFGAPDVGFTPWYGSYNGEEWGYDWDGEVQLANDWNTCCAGAANYVSFLLKGDYDEQGWIQFLGNGNHHFNWVKENGKYYILDLTLYQDSGRYSTYAPEIIECDSLQDYVDNKWSYDDKSLLTHIYYAVEDGVAHPGNFSPTVLRYPKDLEGKMGMLYVKKGYKDYITFKNPTVKITGYNTYNYVEPYNHSTFDKVIDMKNNYYK